MNQIVIQRNMDYEEYEIYYFGLECMFLKWIHYISYLVIALMLDSAISILISACVFVPIRCNAGGYHAKTRARCYIFSCTMIALLCGANRIICSIGIGMGIIAIATFFIYLLAPVDNKNRILSQDEKKFFRKRVIKCLCMGDLWAIILCLIGVRDGYYLVNGIACASVMVGLGKLTNYKICKRK